MPTQHEDKGEGNFVVQLSGYARLRPGIFYDSLVRQNKAKPLLRRPEIILTALLVVAAALTYITPQLFLVVKIAAFIALTVGMFAVGYFSTRALIIGGQLEEFAATPQGIAQPLIDLNLLHLQAGAVSVCRLVPVQWSICLCASCVAISTSAASMVLVVPGY